MRIGCCVNMIAGDAQHIGINWVEHLAKTGYDYVELPLSQMMDLQEDDFEALVKRVEKSGISCEVCNNFFPGSLRLTGADIDMDKIGDYVERALDRALRLGALRIVFGSSGAKNVPDGFPMEKAYHQIVDVLKLVDDKINNRDILIVIEPLCRQESNIINLVSEGERLVKDVDRKHIRLLADFYHITMEQEPVAHMEAAGDYLHHCHIANPVGRIFPALSDGADYISFFRALVHIGYADRVSIEAYASDVPVELGSALKAVQIKWQEALSSE